MLFDGRKIHKCEFSDDHSQLSDLGPTRTGSRRSVASAIPCSKTFPVDTFDGSYRDICLSRRQMGLKRSTAIALSITTVSVVRGFKQHRISKTGITILRNYHPTYLSREIAQQISRMCFCSSAPPPFHQSPSLFFPPGADVLTFGLVTIVALPRS